VIVATECNTGGQEWRWLNIRFIVFEPSQQDSAIGSVRYYMNMGSFTSSWTSLGLEPRSIEYVSEKVCSKMDSIKDNAAYD
jgi:hypothetical protein